MAKDAEGKREGELNRIKLSWSTWSDICNFVPDSQFVTGTWLDDEGQPSESVRFANDSIGLILLDNSGKRFLVKAGEWLTKGADGQVQVLAVN